MKNSKIVLGLDLGTNSVGWGLIDSNFKEQTGEIIGTGSRILPMSQDVLGKFDSGQSISQTAERTSYRGVRRLNERNLLRKERLHRVLNILNFLPIHYKNEIDFKNKLGQFKTEIKLNYLKNTDGKNEFLFIDSFQEMCKDFEEGIKIPLDWTIYYLRTKALSQKISKEELAWILLNFNQKRGYYQLRGEEVEDTDKEKNQKFEILYVSEVKDSGEVIKNTDKKLFDIFFDNGWKYDKQTTKPEDWLNKNKEFIVTTSILKDGETKRSFKAVDSEKDWIAIKTKTEQDINESKKTVGQYIYDSLIKDTNQKINGKLIKTIERKFYKEELSQILKAQMKYHIELTDEKLLSSCVEELYSRNYEHANKLKSKDFHFLFLEDIIFYQRPLKSKKSTISNCPYETRVFIHEGVKQEQSLKCIHKSNPIYQEFRIWQFLKNLKIYANEKVINGETKLDIDVTEQLFQNETDWTNLFIFLNSNKEVDQKKFLKYLVDNGKIESKQKNNFRWNYVEDKTYPCNETRALLENRLKKVENVTVANFLNPEIEFQLWHIIYSVKDKTQFEITLKNFAIKNNIDENSFVANFKNIPPFKNDYGAYSEKAIKKLLTLMRRGQFWNEDEVSDNSKLKIESITERLDYINYDLKELDKKNVTDDDIPKAVLKSFIPLQNQSHLSGLNTYQACYVVYNRHSELGIIKKWYQPNDIDSFLDTFKQHSLRNPIVEQVITETLRVVRDIWKFYGNSEPNFFNEIHLELGREMKNDQKKRKSITERNITNENTNARIKAVLENLMLDSSIEGEVRPFSPSHQEILKIYEEGVYDNSAENYASIKLEDIDKIRKSNTVSKSDINKYKLWLEQGYVSPYTGRMIPLSKLFTTAYQIEHIIPQSRYFDNSMNNKVICESEVNQVKDNKTAYEFIKTNPGLKIDLGFGKNVTLFNLSEYEAHCTKYFKNNKAKKSNLLSEEIPEGFINRQLNDSRYISKYIKSLLSNIVREDEEKEETSKNLIPINGVITSKLKQDWGLNDKWNEIIKPRFERLNEMTNSNGFGFFDKEINAFRIQVPDDIAKGFNKKRIDHRHHALDALIIACCTREHTNYLNSLNSESKNYALRDTLLIKNKENDYTKNFKLPWASFPTDAKNKLEETVISFKKNTRVINKNKNKTWQWVKKDNGKLKKELVEQSKGINWAIRKPMHKETVSGLVKIKQEKSAPASIANYIENWDLIIDKAIRYKMKSLNKLFNKNVADIKKHLKEYPITINNKPIDKIAVYEMVEATATRVKLSPSFSRKNLNSITDSGIRDILNKHLLNYTTPKGEEQFDLAFAQEGLESLNKNIKELNNTKEHKPIQAVRIYEVGNKFQVGLSGNKKDKYVEAAKGTNLFFAVYYNEDTKKREFETIPLNEVIEHQKQDALKPKKERTEVPIKNEKGQFLFSLSPNDLVYVPNEEELENPSLVDFKNLSKIQVNRVYKIVSFTGNRLHALPNSIAISIINKVEFTIINKLEFDFNKNSIKDYCWKLNADKLGNLFKVMR